MAVSGLEKVLANLNAEVEAIEGRTLRGVVIAAMSVRRSAQQITPVRTGNLRGSAYTIAGRKGRQVADPGEGPNDFDLRTLGTAKSGRMLGAHKAHVADRAALLRGVDEPYAEIGFTANYATAVHENVEARYRQGTAKFLERALNFSQSLVLSIIREEARVK